MQFSTIRYEREYFMTWACILHGRPDPRDALTSRQEVGREFPWGYYQVISTINTVIQIYLLEALFCGRINTQSERVYVACAERKHPCQRKAICLRGRKFIHADRYRFQTFRKCRCLIMLLVELIVFLAWFFQNFIEHCSGVFPLKLGRFLSP